MLALPRSCRRRGHLAVRRRRASSCTSPKCDRARRRPSGAAAATTPAGSRRRPSRALTRRVRRSPPPRRVRRARRIPLGILVEAVEPARRRRSWPHGAADSPRRRGQRDRVDRRPSGVTSAAKSALSPRCALVHVERVLREDGGERFVHPVERVDAVGSDAVPSLRPRSGKELVPLFPEDEHARRDVEAVLHAGSARGTPLAVNSSANHPRT